MVDPEVARLHNEFVVGQGREVPGDRRRGLSPSQKKELEDLQSEWESGKVAQSLGVTRAPERFGRPEAFRRATIEEEQRQALLEAEKQAEQQQQLIKESEMRKAKGESFTRAEEQRFEQAKRQQELLQQQQKETSKKQAYNKIYSLEDTGFFKSSTTGAIFKVPSGKPKIDVNNKFLDVPRRETISEMGMLDISFDKDILKDSNIDKLSEDKKQEFKINTNQRVLDVPRRETIIKDVPKLESPPVFEITKPTLSEELRYKSFKEFSSGGVSLLGFSGAVLAGGIESAMGTKRFVTSAVTEPVETVAQTFESVVNLPQALPQIGMVISQEPAFATGFALGEIIQFKSSGLITKAVRGGSVRLFEPSFESLTLKKGFTKTPLSKTFVEKPVVFFDKNVLGEQISFFKPSKLALEKFQRGARIESAITEGTKFIKFPGQDLRKALSDIGRFTEINIKTSLKDISPIRKLVLARLKLKSFGMKLEPFKQELRLGKAIKESGVGKVDSSVFKPSQLALEKFQRGARIKSAITQEKLLEPFKQELRLRKAIKKSGVGKVDSSVFKPSQLALKKLVPLSEESPFIIKKSKIPKDLRKLLLKRLKSKPKVSKIPKLVIEEKPPRIIKTIKDFTEDVPKDFQIQKAKGGQQLLLKKPVEVPKPVSDVLQKDVEIFRKFPGFVLPESKFGVPEGKVPLLFTTGRIPSGFLQPKVDLKELSSVKIKPKLQNVKQGLDKIKTKQFPMMKSKERTETLIFPKVKEKERQLSNFGQVQIAGFGQAQPFAQKQPSIFPTSLSKLGVAQSQRQREDQGEKLRFGEPEFGREELKKSSLFKSKFPQKKPSKLYTVSVRRRGKFKPILTTPSLKKAFEVGRGRVAKTLAVTFKIQSPGKLRTPKGFIQKAGGIFIEKRKYRLSKRGEVAEIQRAKKVKKKKKKMKGGRK